jgi:hypothetical protein
MTMIVQHKRLPLLLWLILLVEVTSFAPATSKKALSTAFDPKKSHSLWNPACSSSSKTSQKKTRTQQQHQALSGSTSLWSSAAEDVELSQSSSTSGINNILEDSIWHNEESSKSKTWQLGTYLRGNEGRNV